MKRFLRRLACWWYRESLWYDWKTDTYWCPNCEIRLERGNGWDRYGWSDGWGGVHTYKQGGCPFCGQSISDAKTLADVQDDFYPKAGRDYM
jgi:hypothetical protein